MTPTDAKVIPCPYGCDNDGLVIIDGELDYCPLCHGDKFLTVERYDAYMLAYSSYLNRRGFVYPLDVVTVIDLDEHIREEMGR